MTLDDWEWLASEVGRAALDELAATAGSRSDLQLLQRLRIKYSSDHAALILRQWHLRKRAAKKFSHPDQWLWTPTLLEQATDEWTANHVASFVPQCVPLWDLCCGAGSDTVALAKRNEYVVAIDSDPIACLLAKANARAHSLAVTVKASLVEAVEIPTSTWVHVDPDRRTDGQRTIRMERFSPSIEFLEHLCLTTVGGTIKLAPGTMVPASWLSRVGLQWISLDATVRQLRAWWGTDAFPPNSRCVSVGRSKGAEVEWHQLQCTNSSLDQADRELAIAEKCPEWIGDVDPALRISGLSIALAREIQAEWYPDRDGYFVAGSARKHPFVRWFRVEDILPADERKLRAYFRSRRVGVLEIKQRRVGIDIEQWRKSLKLEGSESRTLFLIRTPTTVQAVVAQSEPNVRHSDD